MKSNSRFWAVVLVFVLASGAWGAPKKETINLNFTNLNISDFITMVSKITKQNILITTPISGKVDFISDHPIDKEQLFTLLQSILASKGFTLVEQNGFLTTVRVGDASKEAPGMQGNELGQVHTQVIQVESANANNLSAQLRFLLSNLGKLVVSNDNNAFIITDYPRNTALIKELILQLDQKKEQDILFMPLKHVKVSTIFTEFSNIVNAIYDQKIIQQKVDLFKNDATNTLIIIAKKSQIERLKPFIMKLDQPDEITRQMLKLIPLKNADATETVAILNDIITKKTYPEKAVKPSISADKQLNALLFIASAEEVKEFGALIDELDRERQQVYVKAQVLEISKNKSDELGVKYGFGGYGILTNTLYALTTSLGGADYTKEAVTGGANKYLSVGVNLLLNNGAGKTLSEPSVLCIDNKESSIYVGKTQSIQTGTTITTTTGGTVSSFTREDIGLTLKIKPRIANDNKVTLEIETKMEDVDQSSASAQLPTTTKREVKTTAIVRDGEKIIIGGLIREYSSKSVDKVPLLGDIPLIGWFFRNDKVIEDQINLVVILTPYIVNKSSDLSALREKLAQLEQIEATFAKETMAKLEAQAKEKQK